MRLRIEAVALGLLVLAVVPYLALKLAWLNGAGVGVEDGTALAGLHSTRMVVGTNVTIVLELAAIGLALALASAWGRRVTAWIVLGVGAGATGLLAPILLGLPIGSVLQLAVQGDVRTGGMDHLSPWVFATVYGGFGLMAVGISVPALRYATARWGVVLDRTPDRPPAWAVVAGGLGLVPFGAAMLWSGVSGPGAGGPRAMDAVVQRTTLVVTGLLALGGFLAPLLRGLSGLRPRLTWLVIWLGCTTAALQAPTQVLLANGGHPTAALVLTGVLTVPGSAMYGLGVLRRHLRPSRPPTGGASAMAPLRLPCTFHGAASGGCGSRQDPRTRSAPTEARPTVEARPPTPPGPFVVAVGLLVALWCAGFAAVSVWFELTDHFAVGQYADDATAISVVNWFGAVLKVVGAAVALLAVGRTPRFMPPRIVGTLLWAAFATLAVYVVGSMIQAVRMLTGVAGDAEQVDASSVGYVLAFLLAATGFGILATSYARRGRLGARVVLIGVCGAPVVLGSVLVILPEILRALGLL